MMERSVAAFDELKQGIRTLENLADPKAGELWIGCIESVAVLTLPPLLQDFMRQYPRAVVHVQRLSSPMPGYRELFERNVDLILGRAPSATAVGADDLACEPLFHDQLVVVAGARSPWARRPRIELGELVDEPWVLTQPDCWTHAAIREAFIARGCKAPHVSLMTQSIPLRISLAANGPYIATFANPSVLRIAGRSCVKVLPIDLPDCASPLYIITLKDRVLNPLAQRFIEHIRTYGVTEAGTHRKSLTLSA
jgi:DNA-binding transcriptional LysR family regulator